MDGREIFRLGELPDKLFNDAASEVRRFSTVLAVGDKLAGSGTFVRVNGIAGILTAQHVWEFVLSSGQSRVGLTIANHPHSFSISLDGFSPRCGATRESDEYGPDIQFLEIHQSDASTIEANSKLFFNLGRETATRLRKASDHELGFVAVSGCPDEFTTKFVDPASGLECMQFKGGFSTTVENYQERGRFDYFELPSRVGPVDGIPRSFGGVSGGGVWRIEMKKRPGAAAETAIISDCILSGVAFYQSDPMGGKRYIRAHAQKTIYEYLPSIVPKRS